MTSATAPAIRQAAQQNIRSARDDAPMPNTNPTHTLPDEHDFARWDDDGGGSTMTPKVGRPSHRINSPELDRELRAVARKIARTKTSLETLEHERNALIHRALGEGWPQRQIAEAADLSHGRIGQMASPRD